MSGPDDTNQNTNPPPLPGSPPDGPPCRAQDGHFRVGQIVHHKLFDYSGVIIDVDPIFLGTRQWYESMAKSRPPKDRPWYHVLVDGFEHRTYVAERNLEPDPSGEAIRHPEIDYYFEGLDTGGYIPRRKGN